MGREDDVSQFPQDRLDVYGLAVELSRLGKQLADAIPRGYRRLSDQAARAAMAVPLLISEGANRTTAGQKRQRYCEARGECGELASAAEVACAWGLVPAAQVRALRALAGRVGAMLTMLERRWAGR